MAALEILSLVEGTPQIRAPGTGDTYTAPRKLTITPEANTNAIAVTGYSVTGSGTTAMIDLAGTWNTTGIANGIKLDITNTASNALSRILYITVNGIDPVAIGALPYSEAHFGTRAIGADSIRGSSSVGSSTVWFSADSNGVAVSQSACFAFTNGGSALGTKDVYLYRDAANTLALRNSTNAQTFNWYGTYASSTDYHRGALKVATATLSGVTGASVTSSGLIPDGAVVIGVTTKVTTGLGTGSGTTGYQVGDGTDPDRWGTVTGTAAGTSTDNTNATATGVTLFTSANDVVITANGGNFNGTGVIVVCVFYLIAQAD